MDPEDKDYVCTLDEKSLEKAKKELSEDPKQRLGAVQALRAWIKAQPHLISRTDTEYLLQVLRTAKFGQLRAREIIETILTLKTKHPDYLRKLDTHDPGVKIFLENCSLLLLPKTDPQGRSVILRRLGAVDLSHKLQTLQNEFRSLLTLQEYIRDRNENVVVNGVIIVVDISGLTAKYVTRFRGDIVKTIIKIFEDANTGRLKGIYFYNTGALLEMLLAIVKPVMKKKFAERIFIHNDLESLYKIVPMDMWPEEYLPDDYKGPSAGPMQAISDNLKNRMMEPGVRGRILEYSSEKYRIDEKKKDNTVPQASFRKLNID